MRPDDGHSSSGDGGDGGDDESSDGSGGSETDDEADAEDEADEEGAATAATAKHSADTDATSDEDAEGGVGGEPRCGSLRNCFRRLNTSVSNFRAKVKTFVDGDHFTRGILLAILINTLSMGIEHHKQVPIMYCHTVVNFYTNSYI